MALMTAKEYVESLRKLHTRVYMLLTKSADGTRNSAYTLRPVLLGGVVLSTGAFVWFVLHNSLRSLREMVKHYFKKQRQEEDHSK